MGTATISMILTINKDDYEDYKNKTISRIDADGIGKCDSVKLWVR